MIIIYVVLFILFLGFTNFLVLKLKSDRKLKRRFYDFGDGNFLVYAILLLIISFVCINFCLDNPHFTDLDKQLAYGKKTSQPWLVSEAYRNQIQQDSMNLDKHFHFIEMHFNEYQNQIPDFRTFNKEETFLYYYYTKLSESNDTVKANMGNLFLGIYFYLKNDFANAESHLLKVSNKNLKYLNNYLGMVNYYYGRRMEAKENLLREIKLNGFLDGAYYNLSRIYDYEKKYELLKPLVYDPISKPFIPYEFRKNIYIKNNDVKSYFKDLVTTIFKNTNLVGFIGALLILLTWVMYLMRVNIHRTGGWFSAMLTVLLSAILVLPVWLLYDFYRYIFYFDLNGKIGNDLLYCVFGIGAIEELIKIIPFLLVLWFTKAIKEPVDYIMYASLSALGFAFIENFQYFQDGSLNIMHSRALTSSIAHMIDSSIIAYGLILAKFKYKKNSVVFFFLFFIIAAFSHGFYDFWLLNESVSELWFVTFLSLLICVQVYTSFINNALNNPSTLNQNVQLNTSKLASDLAASLIGIFLFEFLCLSFIYGPTIGNRELIGSALSGGYMILFLSIRLSNIDVFPGDWARLNFLVGLLPVSIIYGGKKPNYNAALGSQIRIRNFRKKGKLEDVLPLEGEIIKREKISGFTGWFLVKLKTSMPYLKLNNDYILIRAKNQTELIGKSDEVMIYFNTIPDITSLDKPIKKSADYRFMDWAIAGKKST